MTETEERHLWALIHALDARLSDSIGQIDELRRRMPPSGEELTRALVEGSAVLTEHGVMDVGARPDPAPSAARFPIGARVRVASRSEGDPPIGAVGTVIEYRGTLYAVEWDEWTDEFGLGLHPMRRCEIEWIAASVPAPAHAPGRIPVGARVRVVKHAFGSPPIGTVGVVLRDDRDWQPYLVRWDRWTRGHDGDGRESSWWMRADEIEPIAEEAP